MASVLNTQFLQHGVLQAKWTGLVTPDTGAPEELSRYPNKSIQIGGTFGGATVTVEGSDDGVTYATINDVKGNAVSATSAARFDVVDVPAFLRPKTASGSGADVTVIITARSFGH
jgi:hypothetical protein